MMIKDDELFFYISDSRQAGLIVTETVKISSSNNSMMFLVVLPLLSIPLCLGDSSFYKLNPETDRIETFIETEGRVKHLAEDKFLPSNILFTDGTSLKTTDGNLTSTIVYIPPASQLADEWFSGFYQLNDTHIVLVDFSKHCLLLVDRLSNVTSSYTGSCSTSGYRDGQDALFSSPNSILLDALNSSRLLLTDHNNYAVREIPYNDPTRAVGTFYRKDYTLHRPLGIIQDSVTGNLYITTITRVMLLHYDSKTVSKLAGSFQLKFADGPFSRSEFSWPQEVVLTNNRTQLLVADNDNHRVRILDLVTNTTSSICTGEPGDTNGDLSSCRLYYPKCLMVVGDALYIGEYQRITRIQAYTPPVIEQTTTVQDDTKDTKELKPQNGGTITGELSSTHIMIIIAVTVAATVLLIAVVIGVVCCCRYKMKSKRKAVSKNSQQDNQKSADQYDYAEEDPYEETYLTPKDIVYYSEINDSDSAAKQQPVTNRRYLSEPGDTTPTTYQQLNKYDGLQQQEYTALGPAKPRERPLPTTPSDAGQASSNYPYDYASTNSTVEGPESEEYLTPKSSADADQSNVEIRSSSKPADRPYYVSFLSESNYG